MSDTKQINGVLVAFSYGCIAGSKRDLVTTKEVTERKGAQSDAGMWSNKLFPPSTCLKRNAFTELRRHLSSMRSFHYANTYVFEDAIWRILPEKRTEAYKKIVEEEGAAEAKVRLDTFINELPTLIDLARLARGQAFKESDYPTPEQIRSSFSYAVTYRPIPTAAGLNPAQFQEAIAQIQELHQRRLVEANETLIKRFLEPLQTLSDQLKDPTNRKVGQVLGTILQLTEEIPQVDLSGNTQLQEMAAALNATFKEVTPEMIKQDENVRKMLGESVGAAIGTLERFGQFGQRKFAD